MNRYAFLAVVWFVAATAIGMPGRIAAQEPPNPVTCEGYPEQRVFLESQGWWKDPTVANPEGRHVHLGTCFPLHQTVRGVLHFDVRIMLHNMASWGAVKLLRVQIHNNGSSSQFTTSVALDLACSTDDCVWWQPIDVDTTRVLYDGRWEFRMTANIPQTAQGHRMYQTTRWHAILANGKPVKDGTGVTRSPGGAGWYTGVSYQNVFCGYSGSGYDFVTKEHSGVVELTCNFDRQTAFASIDPSFHADPPDPGMVLLDSPVGGIHTISINTTTLHSGAHKLFLRTDATGTNPPGTGSGVLVLPFTVQAPGPDITVTPASHDYGSVSEGSSESKAFGVSSTGTADLNVAATTLTGTDPGEFNIDSGGAPFLPLQPGASQDVMVSFNPTLEGSKSATLEIVSDDPDEPIVNIVLSGHGVIPTPDITVTPASHDYGSVTVGSSKSKTFGVSNTGTADLNVAATTLTGTDPGEFNIDSGGAPFLPLQPGASQDVIVSFNPTSLGAKSTSLRISNSNDPDEGTFDVPLSGSGVDNPPPGGEVTHQETQTGGSTSSSSLATSVGLVGVGNQLYLAAISSKPFKAVSTVSGLGLTWTRVDAQCSGQNSTGLEVWKAHGTPSGGGVVTATLSGTPSNAAIAVSRYSNASTTNPVGNFISGNTKGVNGACSGGTNSSSYSFNLTTNVPGAVAYGAVTMRGKTHAPGAGYTERVEFKQGSSGSEASVAVEDRGIGSPDTLVNGAFSGTVDWAMVGLEITPQ